MNIGIIGYGNMGQALAKAAQHNVNNIITIYRRGDSLDTIFQQNLLVICVKPKDLSELISLINLEIKKEFDKINTPIKLPILLTVIAGKEIIYYQKMIDSKYLDSKPSIIRAMPNLAVKAEFGLMAVTNKGILNTIFPNIFIDEIPEEQFSTWTALAGCGPAYFYLFSRFISESAQKFGLDKDHADFLTKWTLKGSASLLNSDTDLQEIQNSITSKGGVTQEALESFSKDGLKDIVYKAFESAVNKSMEMI